MDTNFDPDAYLADKNAPFDPDAYLADKQGQEGPLEAFGRGALRNIPMAQQAVAGAAPLASKIGLTAEPTYSAEMKHLTEAAEQGKTAHPWAYGAGAVAGTAAGLAPLAIPGVGEAMEAAPILSNAALGAAQGLSDTNFTKPTADDIKQAAVGGGLGAGLGAAGKFVRYMAPTAKQLGVRATAKGIQVTGQRLMHLVSKDPDAELMEMNKWANAARTPTGEKIIELNSRPDNIFKNIGAVHDAYGKKLGDIIDKVAPHAKVDGQGILSDLTPLYEDVKSINPEAETKVGGTIKRVQELMADDRLNLHTLQDLKGNIGENMGDIPAMHRAYGKLAERMDGIIESYENLIGDAGTLAEYKEAKNGYRIASKFLPVTKYANTKDISHGVMGNSGLLGFFGLAAGVAAGHPLAGVASALSSAVGRPVAEVAGRNAAFMMAPHFPKVLSAGRGLNKAAQVELTNYLQSRFGKKP